MALFNNRDPIVPALIQAICVALIIFAVTVALTPATVALTPATVALTPATVTLTPINVALLLFLAFIAVFRKSLTRALNPPSITRARGKEPAGMVKKNQGSTSNVDEWIPAGFDQSRYCTDDCEISNPAEYESDPELLQEVASWADLLAKVQDIRHRLEVEEACLVEETAHLRADEARLSAVEAEQARADELRMIEQESETLDPGLSAALKGVREVREAAENEKRRGELRARVYEIGCEEMEASLVEFETIIGQRNEVDEIEFGMD